MNVKFYKFLIAGLSLSFSLAHGVTFLSSAECEISADADPVLLELRELSRQRNFLELLRQVDWRMGYVANARTHAWSALTWELAKLHGKALLGLGRLYDAEMWMNDLYEVNDKDTFAAEITAGIYLARRDFENALAISDWLIENNPNNGTGWGLKVKALRGLRRLPEMIEVATEQLSRNPNNIFAHKDLASAYALQGRHALALEVCRKVLALHPHDETCLGMAGDSALALGWPDTAYEYASEKLRRYPDTKNALTLMAKVLIAMKRFDEATKIANRKLILEASPSRALDLKLQIAEERDGRQAALAQLEKLWLNYPRYKIKKDVAERLQFFDESRILQPRRD
jgi:tetratricopeptide (TPR) repeat protein